MTDMIFPFFKGCVEEMAVTVKDLQVFIVCLFECRDFPQLLVANIVVWVNSKLTTAGPQCLNVFNESFLYDN